VAGVFAGIGFVSMYIGLSRGSTTVVSTLGAMYFVVAAFIGMAVLGDQITTTRVAGLLLAGVGVVLVAQ
jgi:bacterial/archaeal transporter family protein